MKIYFQWLGDWIELDNEKDIINGTRAIDFVYKLTDHDNSTIEIKKDATRYYIPMSLLVYSITDTGTFVTEEKW